MTCFIPRAGQKSLKIMMILYYEDWEFSLNSIALQVQQMSIFYGKEEDVTKMCIIQSKQILTLNRSSNLKTSICHFLATGNDCFVLDVIALCLAPWQLSKVKSNPPDHPLVAGCNIGHTPCLLHVSKKDMGQKKKSKLPLNNFFPEMFSVILCSPYHTIAPSSVHALDKFGFNKLYDAIKTVKYWLDSWDWLVISQVCVSGTSIEWLHSTVTTLQTQGSEWCQRHQDGDCAMVC